MRLCGAVLLAAAVPASVAEPVVERDVAAPMRDGVVLRADVLRPAGAGPFPVLVYRTPYGKTDAQADYATFRRAVERGYAVVVQDVRGRFSSDGEFVAYRHEGKDGYDTIEWAARQPWSDGRVGTFGLSYPGAVQWLAAIGSPPHLLAMAPAMTYARPDNFFHSGGVFDLSWIGWIWRYIAPDVRARRGLPGPRSDEEAEADWARRADELRRRLPLSALHELREVAPFYFDWIEHAPGDPWWEWADLRGKYGRVKAAVLNLSGWHDEAYGPDGAIANHLGLLASRGGEPDLRSWLVLGPWVHGVAATAQTRSGDREFGAAAAIDYDELVLGFMDRYLRGLDVGPRASVRVFVMGENAWRDSGAWPVAPTDERPLYLSAARGARGGLVFDPARARAGARTLISDPASPLADPFAAQAGAHDYRGLAGRPDAAVFDSEPLSEGLTVVGPIRAEIKLSVDAPDADLWVKLLDVAPDGTAFNLMSPGLDVLRASYRDGGPDRKLLEPGRPYVLRLGGLLTGNRFAKGHRIRVVLAGAFFPHFSRNLHTGELETTSARMRKAVLTVHCGGAGGSRLELPVLP